ncbi:MAG TPA: DUF3426 domain-containing protein [Caulobacteraceae bacterium]
MILTCPECATRYFVADDRIGPEGRTVRCASCGNKWQARPDEPLELASSPDEGALGNDAAWRGDEPEMSDLTGDALPKAFRERAQTRVKVREAATVGVVWAGLIVVLALVVGLMVVLRQDIARVWPRTAGAYALIGLPVNLVGLAIENQHAQPALRDGHAALVVTGSLRNIRDRPVPALPLRISLLNASGKAVQVKIADPGGARIPPGEARRFSVDMLDPPVSASDVQIEFVVDGRLPRAATPGQATPPPARASLRGLTAPSPTDGPAVVTGPVKDAAPLPSGSPYALPDQTQPPGPGHG